LFCAPLDSVGLQPRTPPPGQPMSDARLRSEPNSPVLTCSSETIRPLAVTANRIATPLCHPRGLGTSEVAIGAALIECCSSFSSHRVHGE
jgi:hypothetical protein